MTKPTNAPQWIAVLLTALSLLGGGAAALASLKAQTAAAAAVQPVQAQVSRDAERTAKLEQSRDDDHERLKRVETKLDEVLSRLPRLP